MFPELPEGLNPDLIRDLMHKFLKHREAREKYEAYGPLSAAELKKWEAIQKERSKLQHLVEKHELKMNFSGSTSRNPGNSMTRP